MSSNLHPNPLHEHFHKTTLRDLNASHEVTTIDINNTVEAAVKLLASHNILSLPVTKREGDRTVCVGLIDYLDIIFSLLKVAPDAGALGEANLSRLEAAGRAMAFEPIDKALGMSGRDPYVPVFVDSPSTVLLDLFARGIHRSPVFNAGGNIVGTVSQSTLVANLAAHVHMGALKEIGEMSVEKLGLSQHATPVAVKPTDTVLHALTLMWKGRVSAVAIVDDAGKLLGNFSASDLKGLFLERFPSFLQPVSEFLQRFSPKSLAPVTCSGSSTLKEVCQILSSKKIHRVWVVDNDKVVGVVSCTDICKLARDFVH